jgi:inhibitor of KinA sporulation pathway (predicted exonuclease)
MNKNHIVLSLDLEMAQPSRNIIQIGAVIYDLKKNELIETFNRYVNPNEPISEYIEKLTGISDNTIAEQGVPLKEAFLDLVAWAGKFNRFYQVVTWGAGDLPELRRQIELLDDPINLGWTFGRRELDVKTLHTAIRIAMGEKPQSGLAKSLNRYGLRFIGTKHSAVDDAINTARLLAHFHRAMQSFDFQKGLVCRN